MQVLLGLRVSKRCYVPAVRTLISTLMLVTLSASVSLCESSVLWHSTWQCTKLLALIMATQLCEILPAAVRSATERAKKMGVLKNSFMRGTGSLTGFCGEVAFVEVLKAVGISANIVDTYDYDVRAGGLSFELKTKATVAQPLRTYENSVSNFNSKQGAHFYVFLRVQWHNKNTGVGGAEADTYAEDGAVNSSATLWFCGFMACEEFRRVARFVQKGDIDSSNGYTCRSDCWNVPIHECGSWLDLLKHLGVGTAASAVKTPLEST